MNKKTQVLSVATVTISVGLLIILVNHFDHEVLSSSEDVKQNVNMYDLNNIEIITDAEVISVLPSDDIQGFEIQIMAHNKGSLLMDDPLPYLQKLYPDFNINSYWVVIDELGVDHFPVNDMIRIDFEKDVEFIQVVGFAPIN